MSDGAFITRLKSELIKAGDGSALEMVSEMVKEGQSNDGYAHSLACWAGGIKGTKTLRDLCAPFRYRSFVTSQQGDISLIWFNMVDAIDTAGLHVRNAMLEDRKGGE